jgi:hypothetical protein
VVWVASGGQVVRVYPASRRATVVPGLETTAPPVVGLTVGAGAVWAATTGGQLLRIDPRTARLVASLAVPATDIAIDHTGVWVVCCHAGASAGLLRRIDPAGNRVVATVRLPGGADAVGLGGWVWMRSPAGLVWRVDPASGRVVATIRFRHDAGSGEPGGAVAVTRDGVWVSGPASRYKTPFELSADRPTAMASATDGLWLGTADGLFHVDRERSKAPDADGA